MGAGTKALIGLRIVALIAALAVVGLGAWCKNARFHDFCKVLTALPAKFIIHDLEIRGGAVIQRLQPEAVTAQQWRDFFIAATAGTTRIWITIVGVSICYGFVQEPT
jgi:hypothetical protein